MAKPMADPPPQSPTQLWRSRPFQFMQRWLPLCLLAIAGFAYSATLDVPVGVMFGFPLGIAVAAKAGTAITSQFGDGGRYFIALICMVAILPLLAMLHSEFTDARVFYVFAVLGTPAGLLYGWSIGLGSLRMARCALAMMVSGYLAGIVVDRQPFRFVLIGFVMAFAICFSRTRRKLLADRNASP